MSDYVQLFDESLGRVTRAGLREDFFDSFYKRFLSSSSEIALKFKNADLHRQKEMLRKSLLEITQFFVTHSSSPRMEQLASIHSKEKYDIRPSLYDNWLNSLLQTVRKFDPKYSPEVELAWRVVLAPGIEYMKFHYQRPLEANQLRKAAT